MRATSGGSAPYAARRSSAGRSLRAVRSPEAPKMTSAQGGDRRSVSVMRGAVPPSRTLAVVRLDGAPFVRPEAVEVPGDGAPEPDADYCGRVEARLQSGRR